MLKHVKVQTKAPAWVFTLLISHPQHQPAGCLLIPSGTRVPTGAGIEDKDGRAPVLSGTVSLREK